MAADNTRNQHFTNFVYVCDGAWSLGTGCTFGRRTPLDNRNIRRSLKCSLGVYIDTSFCGCCRFCTTSCTSLPLYNQRRQLPPGYLASRSVRWNIPALPVQPSSIYLLRHKRIITLLLPRSGARNPSSRASRDIILGETTRRDHTVHATPDSQWRGRSMAKLGPVRNRLG